ncbi:ThiF family adenylyltransferase [Agrobacterium salinitolerans]|uniref:Shikimate dehydrogenase n=1 Tax=Agrobacterium salinitolerans TaxID=1183413 RepID=A0A9X3R1C2_9HYPH|nr:MULTISPECIES: ThiF family adenylyltransferase [Agrobacterium]MCZ7854642.1 ThiF family adenylyltransferase [Agrobacterium salinitolerans]MCZ7893957.1 ThiF family adenylyltransferase [Agrobacterium salinitolerans]MCZ7939908.1 ThiF family adenylyltransferase [Agrobacterium salinitolerans]TRA84250.1 shikimate dehydrogenase [Agrobacterium salinitolerans]
MKETIPNLDGHSRIYAVFGDPIYQVQTPTLINPIFAAAGQNIYAVPFHVTAERFADAWDAFAAMSNVSGISTTVPHKVNGAKRCDTLTPTARAVGAVNCVQRGADGRMHGALFDGIGFVEGLGEAKARIRGSRVLVVGAGGAGRAIAFSLAEEGVGQLGLMDLSADSIAFTANMINAVTGRECARAVDASSGWEYDVVINASPIGIKGTAVFPMPDAAIRPDMLVADIASLTGETALLRAARAAGATTSDGKDMLGAQIRLMAGFAAGLPAGTVL